MSLSVSLCLSVCLSLSLSLSLMHAPTGVHARTSLPHHCEFSQWISSVIWLNNESLKGQDLISALKIFDRVTYQWFCCSLNVLFFVRGLQPIHWPMRPWLNSMQPETSLPWSAAVNRPVVNTWPSYLYVSMSVSVLSNVGPTYTMGAKRCYLFATLVRDMTSGNALYLQRRCTIPAFFHCTWSSSLTIIM